MESRKVHDSVAMWWIGTSHPVVQTKQQRTTILLDMILGPGRTVAMRGTKAMGTAVQPSAWEKKSGVGKVRNGARVYQGLRGSLWSAGGLWMAAPWLIQVMDVVLASTTLG